MHTHKIFWMSTELNSCCNCVYTEPFLLHKRSGLSPNEGPVRVHQSSNLFRNNNVQHACINTSRFYFVVRFKEWTMPWLPSMILCGDDWKKKNKWNCEHTIDFFCCCCWMSLSNHCWQYMKTKGLMLNKRGFTRETECIFLVPFFDRAFEVMWMSRFWFQVGKSWNFIEVFQKECMLMELLWITAIACHC